jgi:hypothetical protein
LPKRPVCSLNALLYLGVDRRGTKVSGQSVDLVGIEGAITFQKGNAALGFFTVVVGFGLFQSVDYGEKSEVFPTEREAAAQFR